MVLTSTVRKELRCIIGIIMITRLIEMYEYLLMYIHMRELKAGLVPLTTRGSSWANGL